jgi:hypothetical protein
MSTLLVGGYPYWRPVAQNQLFTHQVFAYTHRRSLAQATEFIAIQAFY